MKKVRPIAIHLPQFHPIPENDAWWGKGFTEWRNVSKAKPLFPGHYQPHIPADLGYYDLRLPQVRRQQAQLAKENGIYGFCYYHYWFNGKRVLELPVNEILASKEPDFPFMLCWANENWTRVWDGSERDILLEQKYSEEDDRNHIEYLLTVFSDPRYIRINDKPVIAVYRSTKIPSPDRTIRVWREEARKHGIELYICRFESFGEEGPEMLEGGGFDAAIEFQPNGRSRRTFQAEKYNYRGLRRVIRKGRKMLHKVAPSVLKPLFYKAEDYGVVLDYKEYVAYSLSQSTVDYKRYPSVCPMWDNSARRKSNYLIFKNSTPKAYGEWLSNVIGRFRPYSKEENFVFINAWNEWAEGNHLEPCEKWGSGYLDATRTAVESE